MDLDLDTARDLWAARFGYGWHYYISTSTHDSEIDTADPFWSVVMYKLLDTSCLDTDYAGGKMRLKEWK